MAQEKIAQISFEDRKMQEFLKDLTKRHKSITKKDRSFLDIIGVKVFEDIIDHFEKQEGGQGRWQAWSESYTKFMQRIGRSGNKILQFSGRLRQSFKPTNYRVTGQGVIWYNDAKTKGGYPYAFAHDTGQHKMPMREFMWLSKKGGDKIEKVLLAYLRDGKK